MNNVLASAIKSGLGELFVNFQRGVALRISLEEMVHQRLPTLVVIESATSNGFVNDNTRQQESREIEIRLYWVCDRVRQGHYLDYFARGKENLDNYLSKHHPTKHYHSTKGTYLVPTSISSKHACYQIPSNRRGCVKFPPTQEMGNRWKSSTSTMNIKRKDEDRQATRYIRW